MSIKMKRTKFKEAEFEEPAFHKESYTLGKLLAADQIPEVSYFIINFDAAHSSGETSELKNHQTEMQCTVELRRSKLWESSDGEAEYLVTLVKIDHLI